MLLEIFLIGWMLRYGMSIISFAVAMMISERPSEEFKLFFYLPLRTFYTGYFMRITRLIAHTMEFFFFHRTKILGILPRLRYMRALKEFN